MGIALQRSGNGWRTAPCYDAAAIRRLEAAATAQLGLSADTLMENAGAAAARFLLRRYPDRKEILILAGPGNNGADGLVAARYLHRAGCTVHLELHSKTKLKTALLFELNLKRLTAAGFISKAAPVFPSHPDKAIVIDALFGAGYSGGLDDESTALLMKWPGVETVALDVPSGVDVTTGIQSKGARPAQVTVSFGALKAGFFLHSGNALSGQIHHIDIGLPVETERPVLERAVKAPFIPYPTGHHKYRNGHVYIIAGSEGMQGAALYAARSAWREGAGIVTMIVPGGLLARLDHTAAPFVKKAAGTPDDLFFKISHLEPVLQILAEKSGTLVCGPGAGRHPETVAFFAELLNRTTYPAVLDADGLAAVPFLKAGRAGLIVTPHSGELSGLSGVAIPSGFERLTSAQSVAKATGATVFAKGNRGFVVPPDGPPLVVDIDTSMYNRAGFGDVLAGAIGYHACFNAVMHEAALSAAFALKDRTVNYGPKSRPFEPEDLL
jgi:NAD(P)H-hydrate epimerase